MLAIMPTAARSTTRATAARVTAIGRKVPGRSAADVVAHFAPHADPAYRRAFDRGADALVAAGLTTPARLAHFMAQVCTETAGLTTLVERGDYSVASLGALWDGGNWHRYFPSREACVALAAQCAVDHGRALFSRVYAERMGNGPAASGDGWTYRGRGLLQTTGRAAYRAASEACGVDFVADPDLLVAPEHLLKPALALWTARHLNAAADRGDLVTVTRAINGGVVGLNARRAWLARIAAFATGEPVGLSRSGTTG